MQPNNGAGYSGIQELSSGSSEFNAQSFLIQSALSRVRTMTMVEVIGVTNAGGVAATGFVDIRPLVNQIDGAGNAVPHGTIYRCPYGRLQGGANAVIMDPQIGDIGWAGFADRDISSAVANQEPSNPGSRRMFDMADGVYIGAILNGVPTQYVQFTAAGINVVSPMKITCIAPDIEMDASTSFAINSPTIALNGALTQGSGSYGGDAHMGGTLTVDVDVIGGGKHLATHEHGGVQTGSGNTGAPI